MSNKNSVLFISDRLGGREKKLAAGLKKLGWNTSILCSNHSLTSRVEVFDRIHYFSSNSEALNIAGDIAPGVIHIFVRYNYTCAYQFITQLKSVPIIVDPYDLIFGMFTNEFLSKNKWLIDNIPLERY